MYIYDTNSLKYKKVSRLLIIIGITLIIFFSYFLSLVGIKYWQKDLIISDEVRVMILDEQNQFTRDKLKEYILELNVKFPYIVLAQAELETGNFTSKIFKENHNLFGMKVATKRPTTSKGEENGHAYYDNWRESVVDYAFYSARYLSSIKTEKEYLDYLKQNYAEDSSYVSKILRKINKGE